MMDFRRLQVLEELIADGATDEELGMFFALTDMQFELWDRVVNETYEMIMGKQND